MRQLCVLSAVLLMGSVWTLGCGGDDDDEEEEEEEEEEEVLPDVECDDVPEYADVALLRKCVTCHDSSKSGAARVAADDVNFDTEAAAMKSAMKAAEEVYEGAMPPKAAQITVTQAEKDALYKWALCSD